MCRCWVCSNSARTFVVHSLPVLDSWMQLWRCSCLPKVCLAKLRKSRLLLKVIFVCCRGPIFASLIYLYPAPVVDVEPILQGKIYPSTFGRPLTVALEL